MQKKVYWGPLLFTVGLIVGCAASVVRQESVYKSEVGFMTQLALQQGRALLALVKTHPDCNCNTGGSEFVDPNCHMAAKLGLLSQARSQWHADMMLFNAGVLGNRPPADPPVVPEVSTLCRNTE